MSTKMRVDLAPTSDILRQLKREPMYEKALGIITDAMAAEARAKAPVDHADYRDGIRAVVQTGGEGFEGALVGYNWKTTMVEWGVTGAGVSGEVNIPATHNFLHAAEAIGLKTAEGT